MKEFKVKRGDARLQVVKHRLQSLEVVKNFSSLFYSNSEAYARYMYQQYNQWS